MDIEKLTKYIETVWTDERSSFDQKRNKTTYAIQQHINQPNGSNMVLAVSGLIQKVEGIKHWIQKCGVDNAIRGSVMIDLLDDVLAACASGAVDTVAARGMQIKVPTAQDYIDFMKKQYNDETDERKFKVPETVNARVLKVWTEHAKREITRYLETEEVTDIIGDCMKNEWLGPFTKFLYWFALNCETGWGVMVDFNEYSQRIYLCDHYYKWMHKLRDEILIELESREGQKENNTLPQNEPTENAL